jgi:hypothetical protein
MPVCGTGFGLDRVVAALALLPCQTRQCVDGGARIGVWVEPAATFGADAAPLAQQQGAAEQVGPDFHAVIAPHVELGPNAGERRRLWEQR